MWVIKRDGSKEKFDLNKIKQVTEATGLSTEQIEMVATKLDSWVRSLKLAEISSLAIRDQVAAELKLVNQDAYNLFTWYQKTLTL